jgi:hypothetical protein
MSDEMLIICGDDGKQVAYRGTCPKCGGSSGWVPAGRVTLAHLKDLGEETLNELRKILNRDGADNRQDSGDVTAPVNDESAVKGGPET